MSNRQVIERRILKIALARMTEEPLVLIQGPRTVGKTYLLHSLAGLYGTKVIDLDDRSTLDAVKSDPAWFIRGPSPILIDEYQHEPSLLGAIKAELNKDLRTGRFMLAGSTVSTAIPEVAQFLTGRFSRLPILPFSQGEIGNIKETFLESILNESFNDNFTQNQSETTREDYVRRIIRGGMPIAINRTTTSRNRWFDEYIDLVLQREVIEVSNIRQRNKLPNLLRYITSQTGQLLNVTQLSQKVGLDRHTTSDYIALLESIFVIRLLPAWGKTLGRKTSGTPKVHLIDSGISSRLLCISPTHLLKRDPTAMTEFGHLLETFVVDELIKQATWCETTPSWYHWRTYDGDEVDLIIERDDGAIVGIEVKSGTRVLEKDFRSLRKLREIVGEAFLVGIVLYTGELSYRLNDGLLVLPIDRLWASSDEKDP